MSCRICHNSEGNADYRVREGMFGNGEEFTYFQCAQCGSLQIEEIPADMSSYYPATAYYSFSSGRTSALKKLALRRRDRYAVFGRGLVGRFLFARYPREDMGALAPCNLSAGAAILDVGCGSGRLLASLGGLGLERLLGIDPYVEADVKPEAGFEIRKGTLEDVEGEWDLIMFHHSLEHMVDPLAALEHVSRLLSRSGTCLVRVPVVPSYAWERYETHWAQIDAPRHTHIYSVDGLTMLAERAGLRLESVVHDSTEFQFWASEQYKRGIPLMSDRSYMVNPSKSIFGAREIREFREKARQLNLEGRGDQAAFYLRHAHTGC